MIGRSGPMREIAFTIRVGTTKVGTGILLKGLTSVPPLSIE